MQGVGILSLRVAEVDRGTERWTVSQDSSKEGTGENTPPLAEVKTTHLSSGSARGRQGSPYVRSVTVTLSIWPHPLYTLRCPSDFKSAHAFGR